MKKLFRFMSNRVVLVALVLFLQLMCGLWELDIS